MKYLHCIICGALCGPTARNPYVSRKTCSIKCLLTLRTRDGHRIHSKKPRRPCEVCGAPTPATSRYRRRTCSEQCRWEIFKRMAPWTRRRPEVNAKISRAMKGKPRVPLAVRFEQKYITEPNTGCWIWIAALNNRGYGIIGRGARQDGPEPAHRISWELAYGPIPEGLHVLHKCDNPPCVNPHHLFLGTHGDNMRDSVIKGRANSEAARKFSVRDPKSGRFIMRHPRET